MNSSTITRLASVARLASVSASRLAVRPRFTHPEVIARCRTISLCQLSTTSSRFAVALDSTTPLSFKVRMDIKKLGQEQIKYFLWMKVICWITRWLIFYECLWKVTFLLEWWMYLTVWISSSTVIFKSRQIFHTQCCSEVGPEVCEFQSRFLL
jgi:hypothetical protein